ncbi:MAG: glycosyltransferase family 2 protein [Fibrobacterota bacterium]
MILLWITAAVALIGALAPWILFSRPRTLPETEGSEEVPADCSVIIPARNEEHRLPALLESLNKQTVLPREIIVADDGSTDGTAACARRYGATVVPVLRTDTSWTGKTGALAAGAEVAQGTWLCFCDADINAGPRLFAKLFGSTPAPSEIISIQPRHRVYCLYEQLSMLFNMLILMGVGGFSVLPLKPSGAFGPFLCIHRERYFGGGGHRGVRRKILEHLSFGREHIDRGGSLRLYTGGSDLTFRMYPAGFKDLWDGWVKGFSSGAGASRAPFLILSILWIGAMLAAPAGILLTEGADLIFAGALCSLAVHLLIYLRQVGSFSLLNILILPLHGVFFIILFTWSAVRVNLLHRVTWKGREVQQ